MKSDIMLSVAIKNVVLVVLIVLIIHFLLKNHLLDQVHKEAFILDKTTPPQANEPCPFPTPLLETMKGDEHASKKTKDADELYKFVFDDIPKTESCNAQNTELPMVIEQGTVKPSKRPNKPSLDYDNEILNEYDDESALNGGNYFDSLKGYDTMAGNYMMY